MTFMLEDTKTKIYWEELLKPYAPKSEPALKIWRSMKPFVTGQEIEWRTDIDQLELIIDVIKADGDLAFDLETLFNNSSEITNLVDRIILDDYSCSDPIIDGFYLKRFLWFSYTLSKKIIKLFIGREELLSKYDWYIFANEPWEEWLKLFQVNNSSGVYYSHFAISDIDDANLKRLRSEKKKKIASLKGHEKKVRFIIEKKYNLKINFERYLSIPIDDERAGDLYTDSALSFIRQQGEELLFYLNITLEEGALKEELERIDVAIKKQEAAVMNQLLYKLREILETWQKAEIVWSLFSVFYQKAKMALDIGATKPILRQTSKPNIAAKQATHPYLNKLWTAKGRNMQAIDISIDNNASIIYGANMSGKSMVLKTVGLLQALAQYGFYVSALRYEFNLLSHISIIAGDYQDVENDLSSFGGEINRISKDLVYNNVLYLLDELGTGTNPIEGEALAMGLLRFLKNKNGSLSLLASHYPNLINEPDIGLFEIRKFQVKGVNKGEMVYEAIQKAEQLGLPEAIVLAAKQYLQHIDRGNDDGKDPS